MILNLLESFSLDINLEKLKLNVLSIEMEIKEKEKN
jgi:hypothetical protein